MAARTAFGDRGVRRLRIGGSEIDQRYRERFLAHEALTHGAAIARYAIFSIAPLLIIGLTLP
jgi:uncharacterized BrkB/YihY/UPF0761 family membrane protein